MNQDFIDLLRALSDAEAGYLIVGAYALAVHGRPRATGDLDVFVDATPENARKVMRALAAFGAPLDTVEEKDFARPGIVFQIGIPPRRIDLLTELPGVSFAEAWAERVRAPFGTIEADFIGRAALIRNKRAMGRPQDLADVAWLEKK